MGIIGINNKIKLMYSIDVAMSYILTTIDVQNVQKNIQVLT